MKSNAFWRAVRIVAPLCVLLVVLTVSVQAADLPQAPSETPGAWVATNVPTKTPSTSTTAPAPPIYSCVGDLHTQVAFGQLTADGYAQCDIQLDTITFQWRVYDASSGALLFSDSGQQTSTTSLSTGESPTVGTTGHRNIVVCFNTYLSGFVPAGDCLQANNV
jgi:hypothetical protein